MALRDTDETIAARLRRHGHAVERPAQSELTELLLETKRRLDAGESFAELSRRDPAALCVLAMSRTLTQLEAKMLLAACELSRRVNDGLARAWGSAMSWRDIQAEHAAARGRESYELGQALGQIASIVGSPGAEEDPERVVQLVAEHFECLRAERMPNDPDVRALVDAAMALPPQKRRALLARAEAMASGTDIVHEVVEAAASEERCTCGGFCERRGEQLVCRSCSRSWRVAR